MRTAASGFQAARALAEHGAHVVLACATRDKGAGGRRRVTIGAPARRARGAALDLADLASVRGIRRRAVGGTPLDLLVNNAGVMALPRRTTADGFEMQIGTNHLGHFALTGLLLDRLLRAPERARRHRRPAARTAWAGSASTTCTGSAATSRWRAYGQSKLANLLFAAELQRRLTRRASTC